MSHGRTPCLDKSTIWFLTKSGSGLPLTKCPPNWLTPGPPWPDIVDMVREKSLVKRIELGRKPFADTGKLVIVVFVVKR